MKISIITTCYNRENTIATALESFRSQDYKNKELVVIDGASKDHSVEIINQYREDIATFISEKDTGIYNALNKGIANCTGDIIGILHSDDFFYDEKTLSAVAACFKNNNADIVYANGQYVSEEDLSRVKRIYKSDPFKAGYLPFGWIPLHTTIYVKREVFEKLGVYREDFRIASDYEISLRWFQDSSLKKVYLNRWVVKMRLGGKSTDMTQQKRKSSEDLKILKEKKLWGKTTLAFKIARKIPQYILPKLIQYK